MIKDTNYVVIPGWVCSQLNLKGNSMMIYSIIYGFSQFGDGYFSGSLEYLQEWTNSTRQGVINSVKKLVNDNLIIKEEAFPYNRYSINKDKIPNCKLNLLELPESKESLHNNIELINIEEKEINKEKEDKFVQNRDLRVKVEDIISYLNKVCHTHFKSDSRNATKLIKARLKEGYQVQDFKDVIDFKYNEWGINPVKFSNGGLSSDYLRPSTLFSPKMEEYLHTAWMHQANQQVAKSTEKLTERSDLEF